MIRDPHDNPAHQLRQWAIEGWGAGPEGRRDVVVTSCAADGVPHSEPLRFRGWDSEGYRFELSALTTLGAAIEAKGTTTMLFQWPALHRSVLVLGDPAPLEALERRQLWDELGSERKMHRWLQGLTVAEAETEIGRLEALHPPEDLPPPAQWRALRLVPYRYEFIDDGMDPERLSYQQTAGSWATTRRL